MVCLFLFRFAALLKLSLSLSSLTRFAPPQSIVRGALHRVSRAAGNVYFEQIRVLKAGVSQRLNIAAWNDGIGPRSDFAGLLLLDPR